MQPLVLPNAKEKVEEATWLENWIRIIAIGYSFWDGFIDCFIIHLAMYLRNCEDPFALHWLLLLCRSLYSRPFFSMVTNVIPVGSVHLEGKEEGSGALLIGGVSVHRLPCVPAHPRVVACQGASRPYFCEGNAVALCVLEMELMRSHDGERQGIAESADGDGGDWHDCDR